MAKIENVCVNGLERAIFRSGYPMRTEAPSMTEFQQETSQIWADFLKMNLENPHIKRAISLANTDGGGHDQFLTGITVDFDLTFSNKAWVEAERYTFFNFISSMSTMHRITTMSIRDCCNDFISEEVIQDLEITQRHIALAEQEGNNELKNALYKNLLYNLPAGFELTAGMVTNYRCLKNMYHQRRRHPLPDWGIFCDWVETLPLARVLICGKLEEEGNYV